MSFDLYVWREDTPITADEAGAKVRRWAAGAAGVFAPEPAVAALRAELLARFPALETLDDAELDGAVWSTTPGPAEAVLVLSCSWSWADRVAEAVRSGATRRGLVVYDPQKRVVDGPGRAPGFTMSSARFRALAEPDPARLEQVVRELNDQNFFVVLERADHWFVQVGYGPSAGAAPGRYALEYQQGRPELHFRCETTEVTEAVRFVQEFRAGDDTFQRRHVWRTVEL